MKKYRPSLLEHEKQELKSLSKLNFSNYKETDVREEFLRPLVRILGYKKESQYSVSTEDGYKLHPFFLSVGRTRVELDYLCSIRKQYFWLIEAKPGKCKNPNNPPEIKAKEIEQAYFYSLHHEVNCPYFIVSNGWFTNLYSRDEIDAEGTPVLSIPHHEIADRFMELDGYVGATQILPFLKEKILQQIRKTLSAEIVVDRLSKFHDEVEKALASVKPKVRENLRPIVDQKPHIHQSLVDMIRDPEIKLFQIVSQLFDGPAPRYYLKQVSEEVSSRIMSDEVERAPSRSALFFSQLLLTDKTYSVSHNFYFNVLYFLLYLRGRGINAIYAFGKGRDPLDFDEALKGYLDLTLFHLKPNEVQRVLWLVERETEGFVKLFITLHKDSRDSIITNVELKKYFLEEINLVFNSGSGHAKVELVEKIMSHAMSSFYQKYTSKDGREFRVNLAKQELKSLRQRNKSAIESNKALYHQVNKELGDSWQTFEWGIIQDECADSLGRGICAVLNEFPDHCKELLTQDHKDRLRHLASLGNYSFAEELCTKLDLSWKKNLTDKERTEGLKALFEI